MWIFEFAWNHSKNEDLQEHLRISKSELHTATVWEVEFFLKKSKCKLLQTIQVMMSHYFSLINKILATPEVALRPSYNQN